MSDRVALCAVLASLAGALKRHPWQTKYVIFPSPRQATVALRALARLGTGWVNAHGMSVPRLAAMLAEPMLSGKGLTLLSPVMQEDLVEQAWTAMDGTKVKGGALSLGPRTPGAVEALARTIADLRMSGIAPDTLAAGTPALAAVYGNYLALLAGAGCADRAIVFSTALAAKAPRDTILVFAAGVHETLAGLEKKLVDSLVAQGCTKIVLEREELSRAGSGPGSGAPRLSWVGATEIAAAAKKAGPDIEVFKAASPWCEVREIWRRVLAVDEKKPYALDQVEVALIDEETYAPLFYELAAQFAESPLDLCTFEHGIHTRHARPARCLRKFLEWVGSGFDASVLHKLLASGDLPIERLTGAGDGEYTGPYSYRLARVLMKVGAFQGLAAAAASMTRFETARRDALGASDEDGDPALIDKDWLLRGAAALRTLLAHLTKDIEPVSARSIADACLRIIGLYKPLSPLEAAACTALASEVAALGEMTSEATVPHLVLRFAEAIDAVRVCQSHPASGKLHVTDLASAGLDARPLTFLPGLSDANYPGALVQDPFLRDATRRELKLRTRELQFGERGRETCGALARLRGTAVFSWPTRDPGGDRECFPSRLVLDAWRLGRGRTDATYKSVQDEIKEPAAYVPVDVALSDEDGLVAKGLFAGAAARRKLWTADPDIARGVGAMVRRQEPELTAFDGATGPFRDPRTDHDFVLSCSRLRTLAECPHRYFLKHVLGVEAPGDLEWDPLTWLDAAELGTLLHAIYQQYGTEIRAGKRPGLAAIATETIETEALFNPPPSSAARAAATKAVMEGLQVFEDEWKRLAKEWKPIEFELAFGIPDPDAPDRKPRHPPVDVPAGPADGKKVPTVMIRGRIDRVDTAAKGTGGAVWDYKSGGFKAPGKNFGEGTLMQPVLYAQVVEKLLKITVETGGFLYVGRPGQRVEARADCAAAGRALAARIMEYFSGLLANGSFHQTPGSDRKTCTYCDYIHVCAGPNLSGKKAGLPRIPREEKEPA